MREHRDLMELIIGQAIEGHREAGAWTGGFGLSWLLMNCHATPLKAGLGRFVAT